jgi:hypothetical protein
VYTHSSATPLSLTEEQSGSLIFLDCISPSYNLVVNLPPITGSAGLNYEFIISNSYTGTDKIKIHAKNKSGDAEAKLKIKQNQAIAANYVVTLPVAITAQIGDKFEVISDGSYWYFNVLESSITPGLAIE